MTNKKSVFETLSAIPTAKLKQRKGKFDYVSWSIAVRELLKCYPDSTWSFTTWEGSPYLKTESGFYVECSVTVESITRTQMMPVLDFSNKPVKTADAMQINKAQMRALAKAIALHGMGLDLWAGEDIDDIPDEPQARPVAQAFAPYAADDFEKNITVWYGAVQAGKITPDNIIGKILTKNTLTNDQIARINNLSKKG